MVTRARRDELNKPALRISHSVHGRRNEGQRVTYLVDPLGKGTEREIPERVVLARWRHRKLDKFTFSGSRLSPTLWRALPAFLGGNTEAWTRMTTDEIRTRQEARAAELKDLGLHPPAAEVVHALIEVCRAMTLAKLVERHVELGARKESGVPDLFLFARDRNGRARSPRFVEVKKPEEPMSAFQDDEIEFLRSLGLPARVLTLREK